MKNEITIGEKEYKAIGSAYTVAKIGNRKVFSVKLNGTEQEFVTDYAKYLLEYLKPKFER